MVAKRIDVDETEYRKRLIEEQMGICPVTFMETNSSDGEILFVNGMDYFLSKDGIHLVRQMFGEKFIDERIVNYGSHPTEDQMVYD